MSAERASYSGDIPKRSRWSVSSRLFHTGARASGVDSPVQTTLPAGFDTALNRRVKQQLPWFSTTVRRTEIGSSQNNKDIAPRLRDGLVLAAQYHTSSNTPERELIPPRLQMNYGDPYYFLDQAGGFLQELEEKRQGVEQVAAETAIAKATIHHRRTRLGKLRERLLSHDSEEYGSPEAIGDQIKAEAPNWNETDMKRKIREAHSFARRLPKGARKEFYSNVNLKPETFIQKTGNWFVSLGNNAVTTFIPFEAAVAGAAIASATPLDRIGTTGLWAAVAATEAFWVTRLNKAATESNNLLEVHDKGAKFLAKGLYNFAEKLTDSRKIKRIAGWLGYAGLQIAWELPWIAGAFGLHKYGIPFVHPSGVSLEETLTGFTGLNVGGSIGEEINARLVKKANNVMSQ